MIAGDCDQRVNLQAQARPLSLAAAMLPKGLPKPGTNARKLAEEAAPAPAPASQVRAPFSPLAILPLAHTSSPPQGHLEPWFLAKTCLAEGAACGSGDWRWLASLSRLGRALKMNPQARIAWHLCPAARQQPDYMLRPLDV